MKGQSGVPAEIHLKRKDSALKELQKTCEKQWTSLARSLKRRSTALCVWKAEDVSAMGDRYLSALNVSLWCDSKESESCVSVAIVSRFTVRRSMGAFGIGKMDGGSRVRSNCFVLWMEMWNSVISRKCFYSWSCQQCAELSIKGAKLFLAEFGGKLCVARDSGSCDSLGTSCASHSGLLFFATSGVLAENNLKGNYGWTAVWSKLFSVVWKV